MNWMQDKLCEAIEIIVRKIMFEQNYCYILYGKIKSNLGNGVHLVEINEIEYEVSAIHNINYQINDIVEVMIYNNDFSRKKIIDKQ
jgi:hypothetical protein